jgi:anaerobic dimethyl sulfoxide reductase subunit B (iron-sulfur subunit)
MSKQLGFRLYLGRCVQCAACEVACKSANAIDLGVKWRRVAVHWEDTSAKVINIALSRSCLHCAAPACLVICPAKAISKRVEDGIVIVDSKKCIGCRQCEKACPYGIPQYGKDSRMQKCHLCLPRLGANKLPACVSTCPADAIEFGDVEEWGKQGDANTQKLKGRTNPSAVLVRAFSDTNADAYISAFLSENPRR